MIDPNKFFTILVPCNTIEIQEVTYKHYKTYGTTYKLVFRINLPEYTNKVFLCKTNTMHKREYLEKHGKTPSNTIGMLAEYLELKQNDLKAMFKSDPLAKEHLQAKLMAQGDRLIKIETTHLTTSGKVRITNVLYTQTDIHATLKEYGMFWDKVAKCWSGDLSNDQVDELMAQYPDLNVIQANPQPNTNTTTDADMYKVFTIATEKHFAVPFAQIRNIIAEETHLPIKKITEFSNLGEVNKYLSDVVVESNFKGRIQWRIDKTNNQVESESLIGRIIIDSGDNTKRKSIEIVLEVKVGSCDNSIRIIEAINIYHTENWEERLRTGIQEAQQSLQQAVMIIQQAMSTPITLESAISQVNTMNFGLRTPEKIAKLREAIIKRLSVEFKDKQTKFAFSQAITNVGSHPEEYFNENEMIDATMITRLQELGFNILK